MTETEHSLRTQKIAALNDAFRKTLANGHIIVTSDLAALKHGTLIKAIRSVQSFDAFTPDDDPYGEHDFGFFEVDGYELFWKLDYYDPTLRRHTIDAADAAVTVRVLTIMPT